MKIPKEQFTGYLALLKESWQEVWKKPVIFIPIAYSYVGFIALSLIMIRLAKLVFGSVKNITDFTFGSISAFILLASIIFFFFAAHVTSVKIAFYRKIALDKKVHWKKTFIEANMLFNKVTKFLFYLVLIFIPIIIIVLIMLAFISFVSKGDIVGFKIFAVGFTVLMILIFSIILGAWLTFKLPLLGYTELSPWNIIKEMWHLLLFDTAHVWKTYLSYFATWVMINIMLKVITAILIAQAAVLINNIWSIVSLMINILLGVWFSLYMFKAYVTRYKPKGA